MHHLRAVLNDSERELPSRPMAVMPDGGAGVVYVDQDASTATITAALEAWGLRVRADREHGEAATKGLSTEQSWATTRPLPRPMSRLLNFRSPVWLPSIAQQLEGPATDPLGLWFMRAA